MAGLLTRGLSQPPLLGNWQPKFFSDNESLEKMERIQSGDSDSRNQGINSH